MRFALAFSAFLLATNLSWGEVSQVYSEGNNALSIYGLADFVVHNCANVEIDQHKMSSFLEGSDIALSNVGQQHFDELIEIQDRAQLMLDRNPDNFCPFMIMFFGVGGMFPGLIHITTK